MGGGAQVGGNSGRLLCDSENAQNSDAWSVGEDFPLPGSFLLFQIEVDTFDSQPLWDLHSVQ